MLPNGLRLRRNSQGHPAPPIALRQVDFMRRPLQHRGLAWISAMGPGLVPGLLPAAGPGDDKVSSVELVNGSLWWLTLPEPGAVPPCTLLARCHPHGRWVQWV